MPITSGSIQDGRVFTDVWKLSGHNFCSVDDVYLALDDGSLNAVESDEHDPLPMLKVWGKREFIRADAACDFVFRTM